MAQTPIYLDDQNRRRRDDGSQGRAKDPEVAALKAELAKEKAAHAELNGRHDRLAICGPGFSGEGDDISYDPTAAGTGAGGSGGGTKRVIIVDNGTANYYDIKATFVGAV